jgi:cell division septum initiation protein DivIVA
MAKALLGQRVYMNDRLVLESARLRTRVRDLEGMIEDLQNDNDRLRADQPTDLEANRQPAY